MRLYDIQVSGKYDNMEAMYYLLFFFANRKCYGCDGLLLSVMYCIGSWSIVFTIMDYIRVRVIIIIQQLQVLRAAIDNHRMEK